MMAFFLMKYSVLSNGPEVTRYLYAEYKILTLYIGKFSLIDMIFIFCPINNITEINNTNKSSNR